MIFFDIHTLEIPWPDVPWTIRFFINLKHWRKNTVEPIFILRTSVPDTRLFQVQEAKTTLCQSNSGPSGRLLDLLQLSRLHFLWRWVWYLHRSNTSFSARFLPCSLQTFLSWFGSTTKTVFKREIGWEAARSGQLITRKTNNSIAGMLEPTVTSMVLSSSYKCYENYGCSTHYKVVPQFVS